MLVYMYMELNGSWSLKASKLGAETGHCVFYGVESWSGVLEWILGVDLWSELLERKRFIYSGGKIGLV